jgi:hypothetical protein
MPSRKKRSEQRSGKKETRGAARRAEWDLIFTKVITENQALDDLWKAAWQSQIGSIKITRDGQISGPCWDAVAGKILEIHRMLNKVRGLDPKRSWEVLSTVYHQPLVLVQRLDLVTKIDQRLKHYMEQFHNPELIKTMYLSCLAAWQNSCQPHAVLVQSHWRRALVLPWRRRRDIARCLSDESSDVVDALISDPWLTDHVDTDGELDERRLVDLAGIVGESGGAKARSKVLRRICASCGRRHAVVREKAFPVCSCGGPHYCSVSCQTAHWDAHHARQCGKSKKFREGMLAKVSPRFCFNIDGDFIDLLEIQRQRVQDDADAADAAVAAAVAAAAMRALSSGGFVSD